MQRQEFNRLSGKCREVNFQVQFLLSPAPSSMHVSIAFDFLIWRNVRMQSADNVHQFRSFLTRSPLSIVPIVPNDCVKCNGNNNIILFARLGSTFPRTQWDDCAHSVRSENYIFDFWLNRFCAFAMISKCQWIKMSIAGKLANARILFVGSIQYSNAAHQPEQKEEEEAEAPRQWRTEGTSCHSDWKIEKLWIWIRMRMRSMTIPWAIPFGQPIFHTSTWSDANYHQFTRKVATTQFSDCNFRYSRNRFGLHSIMHFSSR